MDHPAIAEVVRQHHVIEQWLSGTDRAGIDSFVAALADDFEIVTPDGETVRKPELVDGFRAAFGTAPGVKIEVRDARLIAGTDALVVVHYEEWQTECEQPNQRVSTAVFARRDSAPLGWVWIALHETWLRD
jgi:hypothetical protein